MPGWSGTSPTSTGAGTGWTRMPDERVNPTLFEPEVIRGITDRLRVTWLLRRFDERKVWGLHVRERLRHHRPALAGRAGDGNAVRFSLAGSHGVSLLLRS